MKEIKEYLAEIGRRGGRKSRRHLDSDTVRIREARRAFRRYRVRCFWSSPPGLEIKLEDVPWVAEQLMRYGDREAWHIGARLCR